MINASHRAQSFVRTWVRLYTSGLPEPARGDRRAEIESDLWEHQRHPSRPTAVGLEIVLRSLLGIPADLSWRLEQATAGERIANAIASLLGRGERLSTWVVQRGLPGLTTVLAWLFIAGGLLIVAMAPFQPHGERGIVVIGAWGILAGLAVRWGHSNLSARPKIAFAAIAAGALPLGLVLVVTVVAPILALIVVSNEARCTWKTMHPRKELRVT